MRDNNLEFKNNFLKKHKIRNLSKNFSNLLIKLKSDIKSKKKTLNILNNNFNLNLKIPELKKFKKFKKIAIIGMGGSILGTEAIYYFLREKINKKVFFFNDINEKKILNFKREEKSSKVLFFIISKSGNTVETLSNAFSLDILKKNSKNIIIISERSNNFLFNLSKKLNLFHIEHKNYIGGRYSVLAETGMIPSYLMGINVKKLRSKIQNILFRKSKLFFKNSSLILSNVLNANTYKNLIFLNYSPELEKFLYWCQQLIAESLGKENRGFLPIISNVPKDHHSLLQLYLDGPKDKIFYIFHINLKSNIKINFNNIKGQNFLDKKTLGDVKKSQKNALIKALKINKIPFREFTVKKIDETTIGQLFSYFILETIAIGKLSKINPFNQPAVEQVKIFTKKLLNKKNRK